ncbi:hypothetical protein Bbelb_089540 [Branchiostoma belcheri]|nr:hypothetical protein Bbelb_089540 [Branchiostoma belcheri]
MILHNIKSAVSPANSSAAKPSHRDSRRGIRPGTNGYSVPFSGVVWRRGSVYGLKPRGPGFESHLVTDLVPLEKALYTTFPHFTQSNWTGQRLKMTRHFVLVLALALLAGVVYPAKSQDQQLTDEDASPDIEEAEMLLEELEDLVEKEAMADNNGYDIAELFGKRHSLVHSPNLASGRPTFQCSVAWGGPPARAVDGNRSPHWAHNSCTHTNEENDPWWYVDLGRVVTVDHVTIVNRRDCCSERITPFNVHVGYSTNVASNPRCGGNHHFPPTETEHNVHCGGLRGRYVGIRLPGKKRILTLCEVEVYASPNLALGKPTFQSNVAYNGFAPRATDGCRDPNWGSQCCTHTPAEANPWLQVDLGRSYRVQWVIIMNRADCCRERLTPFNIHIGNNARVDQNPRCGGHHTMPAGKNKDAINCNGLTGRYVGIRLPGYGRILTVCEIEVYTGTLTKRTSEVRETEGKGCGEHEVRPEGQSWVGDEEEHNCNCDAGEEFCYKVECGDDGEKKPIKGEEGMWTCEETEETEETAREFLEETMENLMEDYKE